MKHLLSIDLEGWVFSRSIEEKHLSVAELRKLDDGYSQRALTYLLSILKKYDQKITFFVVGKLELLYPGTIEKILADGHEVGWHTHTHPNIDTREILLKELALSSKIIKEYSIKGFQAPTITFFREGYKILKEHGFTYSSSIYGNSNRIYTFDDVYEIPVSVMKGNYTPLSTDIKFPSNMTVSNVLKFGVPYGSSFFWGILGKRFYIKKLKDAEKQNAVCNLFMHEWQLMSPTSDEYKKDVSFLKSPLFFPYKINVSAMFEELLANFRFQSFNDYIKTKDAKKKINL